MAENQPKGEIWTQEETEEMKSDLNQIQNMEVDHEIKKEKNEEEVGKKKKKLTMTSIGKTKVGVTI